MVWLVNSTGHQSMWTRHSCVLIEGKTPCVRNSMWNFALSSERKYRHYSRCFHIVVRRFIDFRSSCCHGQDATLCYVQSSLFKFIFAIHVSPFKYILGARENIFYFTGKILIITYNIHTFRVISIRRIWVKIRCRQKSHESRSFPWGIFLWNL